MPGGAGPPYRSAGILPALKTDRASGEARERVRSCPAWNAWSLKDASAKIEQPTARCRQGQPAGCRRYIEGHRTTERQGTEQQTHAPRTTKQQQLDLGSSRTAPTNHAPRSTEPLPINPRPAGSSEPIPRRRNNESGETEQRQRRPLTARRTEVNGACAAAGKAEVRRLMPGGLFPNARDPPCRPVALFHGRHCIWFAGRE